MRAAEARAHAEHLVLGGSRVAKVVDELIANRLADDPELRRWWETMSDQQARVHEGEEHPIEEPHLRSALRLCHAWRVRVLRQRLGAGLSGARILDVGDVDGLMLKALGREGIGFNLSAAAVERIRANGVEARLGDGHRMPFDDASFDVVLCFETLEHVESPVALLDELARVCAPGGRVYVSVPWVAATRIYPRDPALPRGHAHCFELDRADLGALVSHSPLGVSWEAVCDVAGHARTPAQAAVLLAARGARTVAGTFLRFQFLELSPAEPG